MMSARMASRCCSPSTASTSLRPCAAPLRSTVEPSLLSMSMSQGTRSLNCASPIPCSREPMALAAVARTSGSGSTSAFCSSGISRGTYGSMSLGSLISWHMLPTMRAARFLVSPLRSRRPRCTTGRMSARLGASMVLTNTVLSTTSRQLLVCLLGSASAASRLGTSRCTSGLRITLPTSCSASRALPCTLGCGSPSTSPSRGTMVGRQVDSCFGAQYAMEPSSCVEPCLVRHLSSSRPLSSEGSTSFTPCPESCPMMARAAPSVASRTAGCVSPKQTSSMGRMWMT
mmetsp:Transcript_43206/g.109356  ORF Transcript_43206/g.109356 Transcript_43206/m.109356 type:complete len:286 (-) Transcript_43206:1516-2373(-)